MITLSFIPVRCLYSTECGLDSYIYVIYESIILGVVKTYLIILY